MRIVLLAILFVVLHPLAASAGGDLCLADSTNGSLFQFTKPRFPKAFGSAAPVAGMMFDATFGSGVPFAGAVGRRTSGGHAIGITPYIYACNIIIWFNASTLINYDCNLDGDFEATFSVTEVDCP